MLSELAFASPGKKYHGLLSSRQFFYARILPGKSGAKIPYKNRHRANL